MLFIVFGILALVGSASAASTGKTSIVSTTENGTQVTIATTSQYMSGNGRYVVFSSTATNLVENDTNGVADVFVKDTKTKKITLVSVSNDGTQGNAASSNGAISNDGKIVMFASSATNLVENDTNGVGDIFVRNLLTNTTTRVSVATNGTQANAIGNQPALSANGKFVVWISAATNLVPNDTNGAIIDVFLRDVLNNVTTIVSVANNGTQSNAQSLQAKISADGRYVVFQSTATNLVPNDTNGVTDVFVRDMLLNTTTLVSVATNGTQGNAQSTSTTISPDGRYVGFTSAATNLVPNDTNGFGDVFIRDMLLNTTTLVSVATDGTQGNAAAGVSEISADGKFVVFASSATNLVENDTNGVQDIFVRNLLTNTTTRVSVATDGTQADKASYTFSVSEDGRYIAFGSDATNLVENDTNGVRDIFLRDFADIGVYPGDDLASVIENIMPGGTITIYGASGNWDSILSGNWVVDKPLTIIGLGNLIITALNESKPVLELTGNASGSVISGLTLIGSSESYGVLLNNVNNITITDSTISGLPGLKLVNSTDNTLTGNNITSLDNVAPVVSASVVTGSYNTSKAVTLTSDDVNGIIYYTTDGSTPTASSVVYSGPITIGASTTLKYIAVDEFGNWSPVITQIYTIDKVKPTATASVKAGFYKANQKITLKISEAGTIYYTLNGATPTASSKRYTGAISVSKTTTVKFLAIDKAGNKSQVYTQKYTIDKTVPKVSSVSPKSGASNVKRSSTITIKFSETVKNSTNWSKIYIKNVKTGKKIAISSKSIKGKVLTIKTSKKSANTQYQIYIPTGAVKDAAGNNLAKAYTYKIKTGKT